MTSARELSAMAKRQLALRDQLWPDVGHYLWRRSVHNGYATIPKTMPLVLKIMDEMTKGAPVSSTYFTLWCSSLDNFVCVAIQAVGTCSRIRLWRPAR